MRNAPLMIVVLGVTSMACYGQPSADSTGVPVATQWVFDAAGPVQRNSIKSVFLLVCSKTAKKGTSFLLSTGTVVSNEHVVNGCTPSDLYAMSPIGNRIEFSRVITDSDRDLALLRPSKPIQGGLEIGSDDNLRVGTSVSTWGFPLIYNGPALILSVGYIAGFNPVNIGSRTVKHIVVNGAFNPGNSGGPVFVSKDNKIVAIVVWKQRLLSASVPAVINGFRHPRIATGGTFSVTRSDGTVQSVSDQEAIAAVLEEFYNTVQVMIGEAISVCELKAFLKSRAKDLVAP